MVAEHAAVGFRFVDLGGTFGDHTAVALDDFCVGTLFGFVFRLTVDRNFVEHIVVGACIDSTESQFVVCTLGTGRIAAGGHGCQCSGFETNQRNGGIFYIKAFDALDDILAAEGEDFHGFFAHDVSHHIDLMDRLFDQLAAGKFTYFPPWGIRNAADSHEVGFNDLVFFREFFQFRDIALVTKLQTGSSDQTGLADLVADRQELSGIQTDRFFNEHRDTAGDGFKFDFAMAVRRNADENTFGIDGIIHLFEVVESRAVHFCCESIRTLRDDIANADYFDVVHLFEVIKMITSDGTAADQGNSCLFHGVSPHVDKYGFST